MEKGRMYSLTVLCQRYFCLVSKEENRMYGDTPFFLCHIVENGHTLIFHTISLRMTKEESRMCVLAVIFLVTREIFSVAKKHV